MDSSTTTLKPLQRRMIGHGAWIMFVAMLAGVGLLASLVGGIELWPGHILAFALPGNPSTWARVHVGGLLNALLVMVVALLLPVLDFPGPPARRVGGWLVATGWANTLFYWASLWAPNRALTIGDNRFGAANLASLVGLLPALVFVVLSTVAVVMIGRQAWRR